MCSRKWSAAMFPRRLNPSVKRGTVHTTELWPALTHARTHTHNTPTNSWCRSALWYTLYYEVVLRIIYRCSTGTGHTADLHAARIWVLCTSGGVPGYICTVSRPGGSAPDAGGPGHPGPPLALLPCPEDTWRSLRLLFTPWSHGVPTHLGG